MTLRRRAVTILLALAAAVAWPTAAWAHAALLRTVPSASGIVNSPPGHVSLTYSDPVVDQLLRRCPWLVTSTALAALRMAFSTLNATRFAGKAGANHDTSASSAG